MVKQEDLTQYISADNLESYFGGAVIFDYSTWLQQIIVEEEKKICEM